MKAFYHSDQARHDPRQFMRLGVLAAPTDLPLRTTRLLEALARHGIAPEAPRNDGRAAAARVHPDHYLAFLETAYRRWRALPQAGPEVLPNAAPYWNGAPDREARPPCPSPLVVAQACWYLGDGAVPIGPDTHLSAFRSAATAEAAAAHVADGGGAAYALCRPSGHHARADRASGFCYLNNAAIAASRLRERFGRVAVLDVDAHHGDGTQEIFYRRDDVITVSVHVDPAAYYPFFTGYGQERGQGAGEGANLNLPLAPGSGDEAFLAAAGRGLAAIRDAGAEALVLSLGYDAHGDDPLGALTVTTGAFGQVGALVRAAGLPTVIVQEGGYAIDAIGGCLDAFLTGFGGDAA